MRSPFRVLPLFALASLCFVSRAFGAITITGYAPGTENAAIAGSTIEDFEDVNLVPGLRIRMGGIIGWPPGRTWTTTLPRTFTPSTVTSCCLIGGPFPANPWDGTKALTNGGCNGVGNTGVSPGTGNFFDFQFADTTWFVFTPPVKQVGMGLSNFQSIGGPQAVTNHELIVNGVSHGLVEALPGWVGGVNVKNRYLVITATAPDVISTVSIQNVTAQDGLVFDKLAIEGFGTPAEARTWGRVKAGYRK